MSSSISGRHILSQNKHYEYMEIYTYLKVLQSAAMLSFAILSNISKWHWKKNVEFRITSEFLYKKNQSAKLQRIFILHKSTSIIKIPIRRCARSSSATGGGWPSTKNVWIWLPIIFVVFWTFSSMASLLSLSTSLFSSWTLFRVDFVCYWAKRF